MPTIRACLWFAFFAQLQAQHDSTQRRYRGQVSTRGSCSKRPAPAGRTSREPGVGRAQCTQCTQCAQCGSEIDRCSPFLPRFSPALAAGQSRLLAMLPSSFSSLLVLGLLLAAAAAAVPPAHAVSVRRTTAQQRSAGTTARSARCSITSPNRGETCSRQHQPERESARAHSHGLLCVPMPGCSSDHVTTSLCLLAVL